jgi:lantibiotic biosynthesis protein
VAAFAFFEHPLFRVAGLPFEHLAGLAADWEGLETAFFEAQKNTAQCRATLQRAFDEALAALPEGPLRTEVYNARRLFFQKQKLPNPLPLTWHTTPALTPVAAACEVVREAYFIENQGVENFDRHYHLALAQGWEVIRRAVQHPQFQRAMLFASHELLAALPDLVATPTAQWRTRQRHVALGLLRYLTRMVAKTSPLSRFTLVGERPAEGDVEALWALFNQADAPDASANLTTKIVPNVAILEALYHVLLTRRVFVRGVRLRLNSCIVQVEPTQYRWWFFDGNDECVQQCPPTATLQFIVGYLLDNERVTSFLGLKHALVEAADGALADADVENYLLDLVAFGLLEWGWPELGMSPSWCGNLYQFLGHLPGGSQDEVVTQATFLLQWLRTAARTLPFQSVAEAQQTQRDALEQVRLFFEKNAAPMPPLRAEQVLYEDATRPVAAAIGQADLAHLAQQVSAVWHATEVPPATGVRAAMQDFLRNQPDAQLIDFVTFVQHFSFEKNKKHDPETGHATPPKWPTERPLTALVQPWFDAASGRWRAVVNHLAPGNGRLLARWWHLLSPRLRADLATWQVASAQVAFPWQGWFNANFQSPLTAPVLDVPGGRVSGTGSRYLLGQLRLGLDAAGQTVLHHPDQVAPLEFCDLGLEAAATRPQSMQALLTAGSPSVSQQHLPAEAWLEVAAGVHHRPRSERADLVLHRAAWRLEALVWQDWLPLSHVGFFLAVRRFFKKTGLPRHVFVRSTTQKPQWIDLDSPVMLLLLERLLREEPSQIWVEEMLPTPEGEVLEVVLEFRGFGVEGGG